MENSKKFLKKHSIFPKISFKDKKPHTVELVKDKIETIGTESGEKEGVRYLVKEDGEMRSFLTCSASLISTLANYQPGDVVIIQLMSKNLNGKLISVYQIEKT